MVETILVVEDNQMNLELVKDLLENQGYEIVTAKEAQEALVNAEQHLPDLILMDINLPGMSGIEITQELKNSQSTQDIPVVALTASAMKEEIEEIMREADFSAYIAKPINTRKFPGQIENILQRSH